jgi:hypothetical protein
MIKYLNTEKIITIYELNIPEPKAIMLQNLKLRADRALKTLIAGKGYSRTRRTCDETA